MDTLLLIVVAVVAFLLGQFYGYLRLARIMKEVAEEQGFDLVKELGLTKEEESKPAVYKLEVETHGEMLYLFDKESDNFICQGSSVQELAKLAKEYKNIGSAAVLYGDKVFAFRDGKSTEVLSA